MTTGEPGRLLLIHSGNSWSTHDVYTGLLAGFKHHGIEVIPYRLDHRLTAAKDWIAFVCEREGVEVGDTDAEKSDVLYQALKGAVIRVVETLPNAIVIVSGLLVEQRGYALLERLGIPILLFSTECPYEDDYYPGRAGYCDVVTCNDEVSVAPLRAEIERIGARTRVEYAPTGYLPELHHPGVANEMLVHGGLDVPAHDVVFVGTGFPERIRFLEAIDWTGIDLGLYGHWLGVAEDSPLRPYIRGGETSNAIAAALYDRAKITLNLFRTDVWRKNHVEQRATGEAVSPRLLEAAAIGACVVSEWRLEVDTVFDGALPTFRTAEGCEATLRALLSDGEARAEIREALPHLVSGYSYHDRARQLLELLAEAQARPISIDMQTAVV